MTDKTDRELLELAAKAAGYSLKLWKGETPFIEEIGVWNPLADDGDALRLAVRLNMNVHIAQGKARAWGSRRQFTEVCGDDPDAATRRAIVRAAAAIGEQIRAAASIGAREGE